MIKSTLWVLFVLILSVPSNQYFLLAVMGAWPPVLYTHSCKCLNLNLTPGCLDDVLMLNYSNTQLPPNFCLGSCTEEAERERRVEKCLELETWCALFCSM